ncbi:MAG: hypothetical protein HKN94_15695 [Acidimicrobiales bacterium]|nr:hypothetical protein [Acidimicrobiales bacterium]
MTTAQNNQFSKLLASWNRHQDLHENNAATPELADSYFRLWDERIATRQLMSTR